MKRCSTAWLCTLVLLFAALPVIASEALSLDGRVMDHAGLLSVSARDRITHQLEAHEVATTNQVVVVTLADLGGLAVEEKGLELARAWQLGEQARDNGAILLVAVAERAIRIETGYGLEGALTDALAADIIRSTMQPAFRSGDFEGGIERGVGAMLEAIAGEYIAAEPEISTFPRLNPLVIGVFVIIGFAVLVVIIDLFGGIGGTAATSGTRRSTGAVTGSSAPASSGSNRSSGGGGFSGRGGGFGGGGASGGW